MGSFLTFLRETLRLRRLPVSVLAAGAAEDPMIWTSEALGVKEMLSQRFEREIAWRALGRCAAHHRQRVTVGDIVGILPEVLADLPRIVPH